MKLKELLILLKALLPAIISLALVIGTVIYFQHQTHQMRQECIDAGGMIIPMHKEICIQKGAL